MAPVPGFAGKAVRWNRLALSLFALSLALLPAQFLQAVQQLLRLARRQLVGIGFIQDVECWMSRQRREKIVLDDLLSCRESTLEALILLQLL
jgi:hypothetical protein